MAKSGKQAVENAKKNLEGMKKRKLARNPAGRQSPSVSPKEGKAAKVERGRMAAAKKSKAKREAAKRGLGRTDKSVTKAAAIKAKKASRAAKVGKVVKAAKSLTPAGLAVTAAGMLLSPEMSEMDRKMGQRTKDAQAGKKRSSSMPKQAQAPKSAPKKKPVKKKAANKPLRPQAKPLRTIQGAKATPRLPEVKVGSSPTPQRTNPMVTKAIPGAGVKVKGGQGQGTNLRTQYDSKGKKVKSSADPFDFDY